MAWPRETPKSGRKIAEVLGELVGSLQALLESHEGYRDSADERGDADATERHESVVDLVTEVIDHLEDARGALEEWP